MSELNIKTLNVPATPRNGRIYATTGNYSITGGGGNMLYSAGSGLTLNNQVFNVDFSTFNALYYTQLVANQMFAYKSHTHTIADITDKPYSVANDLVSFTYDVGINQKNIIVEKSLILKNGDKTYTLSIDSSGNLIATTNTANSCISTNGDLQLFAGSNPAASWWDALGGYVDGNTIKVVNGVLTAVNQSNMNIDVDNLTNYYTKTKTDELLSELVLSTTLISNYYTKTKTDELLSNLVNSSSLSNYFTKTEINNTLSGYSLTSHSHSYNTLTNLPTINRQDSYTASAGAGNGFKFPNDAYGGGSDTAGIQLVSKGGEAQTLELYLTNDGDDTVNINVPSNFGATVNGNYIYHSGIFNPTDYQPLSTAINTGNIGNQTVNSAYNLINNDNYLMYRGNLYDNNIDYNALPNSNQIAGYHVPNGTSNSNYPINDYGVFQSLNCGTFQTQLVYSNSNRIFFRTKHITGSWNDNGWNEIYTTKNFNPDNKADKNGNYSNPFYVSGLGIANGNLALQQGDGTSLRVSTAYGYTDIGAQNGGWSHFQTDRANFYFNTNIHCNGRVYDYATQQPYWHKGDFDISNYSNINGSFSNNFNVNNLSLSAGNGNAINFWNGDSNYSIFMASSPYGGNITNDSANDYNLYYKCSYNNRGHAFITGNQNITTQIVNEGIYQKGWFRNVNINEGWYNQTTTAGLYSTAYQLIETYNSSSLKVNGNLTCNNSAYLGSIYVGSTPGDPTPVITARTVPADQGGSTEKTELILFHSNDNANGSGVDLITLRSPGIRLQTYDNAAVGDINNAAGSNDRLYISPNGTITLNNSFKVYSDSNGVSFFNPAGTKIMSLDASGNIKFKGDFEIFSQTL